MKAFSKIETERLILRPLAKEDATKLFQYRSLPEVYKYQGFIPEKIDDAVNFIERHNEIKPGSWMQLAITLKSSNEMIGDCGMHFTDDDFQQVEIGFSLDPEFHGKGFASEAVKGIIDFLFNELKTHRVYGSCDPDNAASIKLMERLGMRKEAHFKKSIRLKDTWGDDLIFAILREEWGD